MPMPKDVGIIDLMVGIPVSENNVEFYETFKPLLMDEESRNQFKMPAQYMFKDIPKLGQIDDSVGWLIEQMDKHNIEIAMVGYPGEGTDRQKAMAKYPGRFITVMEVNPNRGMEVVREIRAAKRDGLSAVSLFLPGINPQVPINDKKLYPIYATCADEGLPIFSCAGVCGPRFPSLVQRVELIEEVVWFFPELKFVMRHGAEPYEALAVKLMIKYPNLYYCTSAFRPKHYPKAIINYANTRGSDKIMYAGYFPMGLSLETIMGDMENVPFKDEVWPKFLRDNARKLFGLA